MHFASVSALQSVTLSAH